MNPSVEYIYYNLEDAPVTRSQYVSFLHEYYGDDAPSRLQRALWYRETGAYRLLLAIKNKRIVGQTAAYRVTASVLGISLTLWWGVDGFVLESERGLGIGKELQMKLHRDLENFSSVSYSRLNGVIKRKCGAKELAKVPFTYLPADSFISLMSRIFLHKKFHKEIRIPSLFENGYFRINKLFGLRKNRYMVRKFDLKDCIDSLVPLISASLSKYDFYVIRDKEYLQWKYMENPTIGSFNALGFYSTETGKILGCVLFSEPFRKQVFSVYSDVITILDCFVFAEAEITKRQMVMEAIRFSLKTGKRIDGVLYIGKITYFPILRYPITGRSFLSTISSNGIRNPYLGYSDHDMEQIGI